MQHNFNKLTYLILLPFDSEKVLLEVPKNPDVLGLCLTWANGKRGLNMIKIMVFEGVDKAVTNRGYKKGFD